MQIKQVTASDFLYHLIFLYHRFVRATMADFLVSSLKAVGKPNYAAILTEVRRHNRVLDKKDFEQKKTHAIK